MSRRPRPGPGSDTADGTGWLADSIGCFQERYYRQRKPTPYVGAADADRVIWDLGFIGHVPDRTEGERVQCVVLADGGNWVELSERSVRFGWSTYPHRGHGTVSVGLEALERFQVEVMDYPEQVRLVVEAQVLPLAPRGAQAQSGPGRIGVTVIFGREHQPALADLCALVEQMCRRPLRQESRPVPPAADGPAHPAGPQHEPPPGRAHPGPPGPHPAPPGPHTRPPAHTLAVTVAGVPYSPEWLSFAAPSTQELLTPPAADAPASAPVGAAGAPVPGPPAGWGGR
jgi:hypothetical protein